MSSNKAREESFDDCVILSRDAFDPDAVFHDDIVDDEVLPYLSLKVDGFTEANDVAESGAFELRPDDVQKAEALQRPSDIPKPKLDPEQLEVYGWESSFWRKLISYIGF